MMWATGWICLFSLGLAAAVNPVPHQTNEESLRSALNALTRKQRSLNSNIQDYYNDLHSFKYREGTPGGKIRQPVVDGMDEDEEDLEFLPLESAGQLETIGDGYQHLNNKQLERALKNYLEYSVEQNPNEIKEPAPYIFRERERIGGLKRGGKMERPRITDVELTKMLLEELEDGLPEDMGELEDEEYQRMLETLYEKLKNTPNDNYYGMGPMAWSDIGNNNDDDNMLMDLQDREQDPSVIRYIPAERRNVNARYPFGYDFRNYREVSKRFPVSKRSANMIHRKRQTTDPKVAQELGAIFGAPSTNNNNNHTMDHQHPNVDRDHTQDHNHTHEHAPHAPADTRILVNNDHEQTTAGLGVTISPKTTKETVQPDNTKERIIEVKKKSIDWSQYVGIDRRKKKADLLARPGTQDQDDEWFLQKYSKTMADNLSSSGKDNNKRLKLQDNDPRLKNMKDLMMEEALISGSQDPLPQDTKEEVMNRLAAAYSLERLLKAVIELRRNAAAQRENRKLERTQNNLTANRPSGNIEKNEDKRNRHEANNFEGMENGNSCEELDYIEALCREAEVRVRDHKRILHLPCVMYQVCASCEEESECIKQYTAEVTKVCENEESEGGFWSMKHCIQAAKSFPRSPPLSAKDSCFIEGNNSCIGRYHNYYRHRYVSNSPYSSNFPYDIEQIKR